MFQQQAESEGVQPNHSNNMPNSSSEEPIHPLPSNLRGSSHQSVQLSEPESEPKEEEEAESEGVQPNVSPSSQSNSSSEEPINQLPGESDQLSLPQSKPEIMSGGVQPNVNPGGSAHQQQFTEAQIAANYEIGTAEHLKYYRSLHNAAKRGDWESAISFIEKDPNALGARITVD